MPITFGKDTLDEGEFAQLLCSVNRGDEPLTITWALKGDVISSEPGLTTTTLGTRTSMLTIQSVGYRHSGTYTCTAKNRAGSALQTAQLRVNGKLRGEVNVINEVTGTGWIYMHLFFNILGCFEYVVSLIETPSLMPLTFGKDVLDEGQFAQLMCIVSKGDEPLTITWALKGDVVSSEPGLSTTTLGTRTSVLTIQSVGYRHSGTYTCTAKNRAGTTARSAELRVNGIWLRD